MATAPQARVPRAPANAFAHHRVPGILIELRRGRGAVVRAQVDPGRLRLLELARTFLTEAARLGLDEEDMVRVIREVCSGGSSPR
jgi:DNA-binding transcriptional regulator YhcF (GntR family)